MFPIPSGRHLSLLRISDYWSREAHPAVRMRETETELIQAWWRGELVGSNGPSRLEVLRMLFQLRQDRIEFIAPGMEALPQFEPTHDGGLIVIRPLSVPLPNGQPESWDDRNCAPAYEALADGWHWLEGDDVIEPDVLGTELTRDEFFGWLGKRGPWRPAFWGDVATTDAQTHPTARKGAFSDKRPAGRKPTEREAVTSFIAKHYPEGVPAGKSNKSIAAEAERATGVSASERTVRRARGLR